MGRKLDNAPLERIGNKTLELIEPLQISQSPKGSFSKTLRRTTKSNKPFWP
jgi:hypothetical protein